MYVLLTFVIVLNQVIELLLSVEMTPLSISTSRKIVILLSKLQMSLSSGRINDLYIPLLLNGIIGILHNRFSHIWEPALDCLTILIGRHKELAWNSFVHYLDSCQSKFLCSGNHLVKLNSGSSQPKGMTSILYVYVRYLIGNHWILFYIILFEL